MKTVDLKKLAFKGLKGTKKAKGMPSKADVTKGSGPIKGTKSGELQGKFSSAEKGVQKAMSGKLKGADMRDAGQNIKVDKPNVKGLIQLMKRRKSGNKY